MNIRSLAILVAVSVTLAVARPAPVRAAPRDDIDHFFGTGGATTRPAETLTARDLPLSMEGAAPEVAELLKRFEPESAEPFEYTLQLVREEEAFNVYRLTFPSPVQTPWPENNVVPAEFYVPRGAGAGRAVPGAVVLDILKGNTIVPRLM